MYKKEELLEIQNRFTRLHFRIIILMIIYLVVEIVKSLTFDTPVFLRGAVICGLLMVEQIFRTVDFFRLPKLVFAIKYVQVCALAALLMYSGFQYYEYILYIVFYFALCLEMAVFFDTMERNMVLVHNGVACLPLIISGAVYAIMNLSFEHILSVFLSVITISFSLYGVVSYMGSKNRDFERAVFAKDRMIDKAMDTNNEIKVKQEKLFYVNEQLGIKRIELEAANHKINVNNMELNLQNDLLKFFAATLDISKINEYFATKLVEELGVKCAGFLKLDGVDGESVFSDYKRSNPQYDSDREYNMFGSTDEKLCQDMKGQLLDPVFLSEVMKDGLYICNKAAPAEYPFFTERGIRSFVAKKLYIDSRLAGVYVICHPEANFFADRANYYENILYQLQAAVNNAFLYSQFADMAKKDGLTGLYNRRILNKAMEKYRHPDEAVKKENLVAAMFDIDNFKSINDNYGHLFGDVAIVSVAQTIQKTAEQAGGVSYRYGGEEFVVMFYGKTLNEVLPVVEQIHLAIRETEVSSGENTLHINTSAGVSAYPELCGNPALIIDCADRAMYKSKTTGKGRITIDAGDADR